MKARIIIFSLLMSLLASPAHALPYHSFTDITEAMRTCETDNDCVTIDKDCGACCDFDAIAKPQREIFETKKAAHCGTPSYICECIGTTKKPICLNKRCILQ